MYTPYELRRELEGASLRVTKAFGGWDGGDLRVTCGQVSAVTSRPEARTRARASALDMWSTCTLACVRPARSTRLATAASSASTGRDSTQPPLVE